MMTATPPIHATAPRSPRTKPTVTVEEAKKHKKPQKTPVIQSPRKIPTEQRSKERMDKMKQLMEPKDLDEEEVVIGIEDISTYEVEPISRFPPYMSSRKPTSKVTKDLDAIKSKVFTPLLPEDILIEVDLLARVP